MPERRTEERAGSRDRRDLPRPSLRLNLGLLVVAIAASFFVSRQRQGIDADFTRAFDKSYAGPSELNQITAELAEMDLGDETLGRELESRLAGLVHLESLKAGDYYLSIDSAKQTLSLKSGNETVREAKVRLGAPAAAQKGAFTVSAKRRSGPGAYRIRLKGARPASFTIDEADFAAIWDRVSPDTRVYIF